MSERHLEDEVLLKLLDGELPEAAASKHRSHIEACWTCRTRLEELENAIGEYVRYRDAIRPLVPPPPGPWSDLRSRFSDHDRAIETSTPNRRNKFAMRPLPWLAAAAAAIAVFAIVRRLETVPSVSAAELLHKASVVEQPASSRRRIQIKTRARTFIRPASTPVGTVPVDKDIEQMFRRANFSWEEPLSARSFEAWRNQLSEKHDTPPVIGATEDILQTSTSTGELRRATLTLRAKDLQPVSETLEFATETVNISEAPDIEITAAPVTPGRPTPASPYNPLASVVHRELLVFSALREIGADLGEPVDVAPDGGWIIVTGTGLAPARKLQLQASVNSIPWVEIRFEDATGNQRTRRELGERVPPATAPSQLRLQTLLASRVSVEDFINHVLDASDAVMARAHALRTLARAFPPALERSLAGEDPDLLASLRNGHAAGMATRLDELRSALEPIMERQSPASRTLPGVNESWQAAEESLFAACKDLDHVLNRTLAGSKSDAQDADFMRIAEALGRVQTQLDRFQRITGTKP